MSMFASLKCELFVLLEGEFCDSSRSPSSSPNEGSDYIIVYLLKKYDDFLSMQIN
jgi:hypothetical protein